MNENEITDDGDIIMTDRTDKYRIYNNENIINNNNTLVLNLYKYLIIN